MPACFEVSLMHACPAQHGVHSAVALVLAVRLAVLALGWTVGGATPVVSCIFILVNRVASESLCRLFPMVCEDHKSVRCCGWRSFVSCCFCRSPQTLLMKTWHWHGGHDPFQLHSLQSCSSSPSSHNLWHPCLGE